MAQIEATLGPSWRKKNDILTVDQEEQYPPHQDAYAAPER
jgi:hypothetical protein